MSCVRATRAERQVMRHPSQIASLAFCNIVGTRSTYTESACRGGGQTNPQRNHRLELHGHAHVDLGEVTADSVQDAANLAEPNTQPSVEGGRHIV